MKMNLSILLSLFLVITTEERAFAQSNDFYQENIRRIDAYINGPIKANMCEGIIMFPAKYKLSKVKSDAFIISFINRIIDGRATLRDMDAQLREIGRKKAIIRKEGLNGAIQTREILLKGNYLRATIIVEFIDAVIVRSKISFVTVQHAKCGVYENVMLDFKLLKDYLLKEAKVFFQVSSDELACDTIYSDNLASLAKERSGYMFNIPGSNAEDWINDIFTKQYHSDSNGVYSIKAPKEFVRLIKENKIDVIKDLLYSPSYFTSIDAMEALIYLSSIGKIQITKEISDRIIQIKKETFIIMQPGAPDVFYTRKGYKELRIGDDDVIRKYRSSL